jgi:ABC-type glutathione transport system ATPase component
MPESLLVAERLSVRYNRHAMPAVSSVDISVARGETVGVVGESGSGKTTLGRALLRLVEPSEGTIRFAGVDITHAPEASLRPLRRRMQMIFQDPIASLNPRHTIRRILVGPILLHRLAADPRAAEARIAATFARVGLPPAALDRYPHELSGGQRQRVGIARALSLEPDFVLADEIVSGLDVSTQAQVLRLLRELARDLGLAMVFISHDLSVVRAICDRVVVMRAGKIVEAGDCETLFAQPRSDYTRALIEAIPLPEIDPDWLGPVAVLPS